MPQRKDRVSKEPDGSGKGAYSMVKARAGRRRGDSRWRCCITWRPLLLAMLLALPFQAGAPAQAEPRVGRQHLALLDEVKDTLDDLDRSISKELGTNNGRQPSGTAPAPPAARTFNGNRSVMRLVQQRLNTLGYDAGPVDGLYGTATRAAILAFQRDNDLAATGDATADLLSALNNAQARLPTPKPVPRRTIDSALTGLVPRIDGLPHAETLHRIANGEVEAAIAAQPARNYWRHFYHAYLLAMSDNGQACGAPAVREALTFRLLLSDRLLARQTDEIVVARIHIAVLDSGEVRFTPEQLASKEAYLAGFPSIQDAFDLHQTVLAAVLGAGCDPKVQPSFDDNVLRLMAARFGIQAAPADRRRPGPPPGLGGRPGTP
ncbi:peptidoglycan-binding protein [Marinibaculum pumilum]|uniref:Peptidoglycan-binding protein n=1 Tax=Marinibaculum pumilum TaxID=1766165 RepID=A0ABV7L5X3_9PROT